MPLRFWIVAAIAAEVVATVIVATQIGFLATCLWFFVSFVLGVIVMRAAGAQAFAGLRDATATEPSDISAMSASATKAGQVAGDSVLLFVAGLFLAVPGVLTDLFGVLLVIPPVRHAVRGVIARSAGRRFPNARSTFTTVRLADGSVVIPGEVVDEGESGTPPRRPDSRPDDDPNDPRPPRQLPPA